MQPDVGGTVHGQRHGAGRLHVAERAAQFDLLPRRSLLGDPEATFDGGQVVAVEQTQSESGDGAVDGQRTEHRGRIVGIGLGQRAHVRDVRLQAAALHVEVVEREAGRQGRRVDEATTEFAPQLAQLTVHVHRDVEVGLRTGR